MLRSAGRKKSTVLDPENPPAAQYSRQEAIDLLNRLLDIFENRNSHYQLSSLYRTAAKAIGWNEIDFPCLPISNAVNTFLANEQLKKLLSYPDALDNSEQYDKRPLRAWGPFLVLVQVTNLLAGMGGLALAAKTGNLAMGKTALGHLIALPLHNRLFHEYKSDSETIQEVTREGRHLTDQLEEEDMNVLQERLQRLAMQIDPEIFSKNNQARYAMGTLNLIGTYAVCS